MTLTEWAKFTIVRIIINYSSRVKLCQRYSLINSFDYLKRVFIECLYDVFVIAQI